MVQENQLTSARYDDATVGTLSYFSAVFQPFENDKTISSEASVAFLELNFVFLGFIISPHGWDLVGKSLPPALVPALHSILINTRNLPEKIDGRLSPVFAIIHSYVFDLKY